VTVEIRQDPLQGTVLCLRYVATERISDFKATTYHPPSFFYSHPSHVIGNTHIQKVCIAYCKKYTVNMQTFVDNAFVNDNCSLSSCFLIKIFLNSYYYHLKDSVFTSKNSNLNISKFWQLLMHVLTFRVKSWSFSDLLHQCFFFVDEKNRCNLTVHKL